MSQGSLLPVTELTLLEPHPIFIPAQCVCLISEKILAVKKKFNNCEKRKNLPPQVSSAILLTDTLTLV